MKQNRQVKQDAVKVLWVIVVTIVCASCATTSTTPAYRDRSQQTADQKMTLAPDQQTEMSDADRSHTTDLRSNSNESTDRSLQESSSSVDETSPQATTLNRVQQKKKNNTRAHQEKTSSPRNHEFMEALRKRIEQRMQERMQKRGEQNEGFRADVVEQDQTETTELLEQAQAPQTEAEQEAMEKAEQQLYTEITGLVIDQSISPFGSHFYDKFYINFDPPEIDQDYTIYITEKASPSFGFILRVKVDDYTIWGKNLRPRLQEIEDSVDEALQRVRNFLLNYERMLQQLGGNDMVGDGIL